MIKERNNYELFEKIIFEKYNQRLSNIGLNQMNELLD